MRIDTARPLRRRRLDHAPRAYRRDCAAWLCAIDVLSRYWILIRVRRVGRAPGGERVEDGLRDGVTLGTRSFALSVQFSISLLRGIAASNEDADGLIDDRHRPQIRPGVPPVWAW